MWKKLKSFFVNFGWLAIALLYLNFGLIGSFFSLFTGYDEPQTVYEDYYMSTDAYDVDITVGEDNSYKVTETITVDFDSYRHGIYRYIPYKGFVAADDSRGMVPYYAKIDGIFVDHEFDDSRENGNIVIKIGSANYTVTGKQSYRIDYSVHPVTNNGYQYINWNIWPTGWQNVIPAGSKFTVHFPKAVEEGDLYFYYGSYGQRKNGSDVLKLSFDGTVLKGTLIDDLDVGEGVTICAQVPPGYFTNVGSMTGTNRMIIAFSLVVLAALLVMYLLFGRDEQIIPTVSFAPPEGLDSAAVGRIVDDEVSDEDIVSLLIYWANRGYITVRETKSKTLAFRKVRDLPDSAPEYAKIFFDRIFGSGESSTGTEITAGGMRYRLAETVKKCRGLIEKQYDNIYTTSSWISRGIGIVLTMLPIILLTVTMLRMTYQGGYMIIASVIYLVGVFVCCHTVDFWYGRGRGARRRMVIWTVILATFPILIMAFVYTGFITRNLCLDLFPAMLCVSVSSVAGIILVGFMKKRTQQCTEWMGYLVGLRDFIETAELDRMQAIAQDTPELFYHILPFAYVFGLSDILLDKMRELVLPAPQWLTGEGTNFDYVFMHRMMHYDMAYVAKTAATPKPAPSSGGGSSGGGFSGGGGSFSGGGFGGGGGGSW